MSLNDDIRRLLRAEGYHINETVEDAINDLVEVAEEETEDHNAEQGGSDERPRSPAAQERE